MKRTKIICTIGPSSSSKAVLTKLIKNGMNVARLNFSHGNYFDYEKLIKNIRQISNKQGVEVAILQDLQGPRIRLGELPSEGVKVVKGAKLALVSEDFFKSGRAVKGCIVIAIQYKKLYQDVKKGVIILIEDGTKKLRVDKVEIGIIKCTVIVGGLLKSHKGINVPGVSLNAQVITPKDKLDIAFGLKHGVDFVALSFVKEAKDILNLKKIINKHQSTKADISTKVIAKIERLEAIENLDSIIEHSDGIMVARGDLGIEMPPQNVPVFQKTIITKCLEQFKPVIVATQMLDSMISQIQPTRAEVSDVANAVIDHTDAVMLSGESAVGKYPKETVKMMSDIIKQTEDSKYDDMKCGIFKNDGTIISFLSQSVCEAVKDLGCKAIVVLTRSGNTAQAISRNRPEVNIVALTSDIKTCRQLVLSWGLRPHLVSEMKSLEQFISKGIQLIRKYRYACRGDKIVFVCGVPLGGKSHTNLLRIETL